MNRIESILIRARDALADEKGHKWSDSQLLRYLDEGQKDLCRRAKLLRSKASFNVITGQDTYKLPDDFFLLDSVLYNGKSLRFQGHHEVEKDDPMWRNREGKPNSVIYDKQMRGEFILYPRPKDTGNWALRPVPSWSSQEHAKIRKDFGVVSGVKFPSEIRGDFGVMVRARALWQVQVDHGMPEVTEVEYNIPDDFGVCVGFTLKLKSTPADTKFGIVTGIEGFGNDETFGVITDMKGVDFANVRFTDFYGIVSSLGFFEQFGYFTHFSDAGLVSDIQGAKVQDLGIINSISDIPNTNIVWGSDFGIVTSAYANTDILEVLYIRKPKTLESLEDELEVDSSMDDALKFFVAGSALISNIDAQNTSLSELMFNRYADLIQQAVTADSKDFTRTEKVWTTPYNGGFN